jgi:hypothetical protein
LLLFAELSKIIWERVLSTTQTAWRGMTFHQGVNMHFLVQALIMAMDAILQAHARIYTDEVGLLAWWLCCSPHSSLIASMSSRDTACRLLPFALDASPAFCLFSLPLWPGSPAPQPR